MGDVVTEGDDLLGEGVNIAARLEGLAEPGGIALSDDGHRQVRDRLDTSWKDGGEHDVKNIPRPVQLWRWSPAREAPMPSNERLAEGQSEFTYTMPRKPSIAVLPFDNLSGDPSQDYIGDGLTETIIVELAKFPDLSIIACNSTFTFKNKAVLVQEVAEKLGARYVLEGGIQIAGDRLRITAQLIDAGDGRHIWAERYDRKLDNLFQLQDDISRHILEEIQAELTLGSQARTWRAKAGDAELFRLYVAGRRHFVVSTPEGHAESEGLFTQAYERAPDNVLSNFNMAWIYFQKVLMDLGGGFEANSAKAREFADRSIAMEDNADAHAVLGWLELLTGNYPRAIDHADRIMELEPNSGMVVSNAGTLKQASGQVEEGLALILRSMRLEPYYPDWVANVLSFCHLKLGQHNQAKAIFTTHAIAQTDNPYTRIAALAGLAFVAMTQGETLEAESCIRKILAQEPGLDASYILARLAWESDKAFVSHNVDTIRKAGLPG